LLLGSSDFVVVVVVVVVVVGISIGSKFSLLEPGLH
jgi:hypothetical protein